LVDAIGRKFAGLRSAHVCKYARDDTNRTELIRRKKTEFWHFSAIENAAMGIPVFDEFFRKH
jgi:hypothetical protein